MGLHRPSDALAIAAAGSQVTTGSSSASTAIPDAADGNPARFVLLHATDACYVRAGGDSVAATSADLLINQYTPIVLNVAGCTKIAYLEKATAPTINISPLEVG